jgi:hypothetical protein
MLLSIPITIVWFESARRAITSTDLRTDARGFYVRTGRAEPAPDAGYATARSSRRPDQPINLFLLGVRCDRDARTWALHSPQNEQPARGMHRGRVVLVIRRQRRRRWRAVKSEACDPAA